MKRVWRFLFLRQKLLYFSSSDETVNPTWEKEQRSDLSVRKVSSFDSNSNVGTREMIIARFIGKQNSAYSNEQDIKNPTLVGFFYFVISAQEKTSHSLRSHERASALSWTLPSKQWKPYGSQTLPSSSLILFINRRSNKFLINLVTNCAQEKTRTSTGITPTSPSSLRVYQFHHLSISFTTSQINFSYIIYKKIKTFYLYQLSFLSYFLLT